MEGDWLATLNDQQRAAVLADDAPLLLIAGAGTGKTNTLVHRVARLIRDGISPSRVLLLTFTRRAAGEMTRRVQALLRSADARLAAAGSQLWSGTFHAISARLLRMHASSIGLNEAFTVVDRSDAEDLLNDLRAELKLDKTDVRFPRKQTCLSIYSRVVNAQEPLEKTLEDHFPWCARYPEQLRLLFRTYAEHKLKQGVLDYDDLLLWWSYLMQDDALARQVRERFDAVLVDEYQDTNRLQAAILRGLKPDGRGLTVVGDDAQSIYSFRAATVHNILEFPTQFPGTRVLKLEQNYRSVQPILDASNAVIALAPRRYNKDLFTRREGGGKPRLVTLLDENQQCDYLVSRILEHHEAGIPLKRQAVLFRAAHHSDALEVELGRRNIPFVKYGGLKFLEAAHVKDVLAILRMSENPRDATSGFRVLQLLDGIGPALAKRALSYLAEARYELKRLADFPVPPSAAKQFGTLVKLLVSLRDDSLPLPEQVKQVRQFYSPILDKRFDAAEVRRRDLEQLEQISGAFRSRQQMLTDLTLDPPSGTQDLAGVPMVEEDYLVLSTMHSAKGCEWDCVYVIHAADGNIPSDMSTGSEESIEEERRLLYVALTRARDFLEVTLPLKYYAKKHAMGDRHSYAQLTRFIPDVLLEKFERVRLEPTEPIPLPIPDASRSDIARKIAGMW